MDRPSRLLPACPQLQRLTPSRWFKGCELVRADDLRPSRVPRHVLTRINYPTDGTSLPRKKKNEVLPLILVSVLFLATPGAITEKRIFWL